jgi:hypothetical protein
VNRKVHVTPVASCLVGIAFGLVVGGLVAFPDFDSVSIVLGLVVTFMGGVSGYICWLSDDRARHERFQRVVSLSAVVAIGVILLAFPDLWRWLHRAGGFVFVVCFLGGITSVSMFINQRTCAASRRTSQPDFPRRNISLDPR